LADITTLTSGDPLFPTEAFIATEKLYAWSVVVDVFHGTNHPIAVAIRQAVSDVCPTIQRTCRLKADDPGVGMEIVLQQEYFFWVNATSNNVPKPVPTFTRIVGAMITYRAESLSLMPSLWYTMLGCPKPGQHLGSAARLRPLPPSALGTTPVINPHVDARIKQRFKDSGFATITELIAGRDISYPTVDRKPLCTNWILKGHCTTGCKRAAQHVCPTAAINKAAHEFLNACGVANPPN
jgi:hypothetical protein